MYKREKKKNGEKILFEKWKNKNKKHSLLRVGKKKDLKRENDLLA